jgi:hypothetical protein
MTITRVSSGELVAIYGLSTVIWHPKRWRLDAYRAGSGHVYLCLGPVTFAYQFATAKVRP